MYSHVAFVRSRVDMLYKQCHKFGLIEQTRVAVFFREHTTTPHSEKLKNVDSKCISQQFFKEAPAHLRQYMKLMINIMQV